MIGICPKRHLGLRQLLQHTGEANNTPCIPWHQWWWQNHILLSQSCWCWWALRWGHWNWRSERSTGTHHQRWSSSGSSLLRHREVLKKQQYIIIAWSEHHPSKYQPASWAYFSDQMKSDVTYQLGPIDNCKSTDNCWTNEQITAQTHIWMPHKHIDVPLDVPRDIQKDIWLYNHTDGCKDIQTDVWM